MSSPDQEDVGLGDTAPGHPLKLLEQYLVRVLELAFSCCLVIMLLIVVTQVALRYGFDSSIGGANELATILFAYTSALGIAVAFAKRDHMAISWFYLRFPDSLKRLLDAVGLILLFFINCVVFYYSLNWINATGANMIPVLQVPRWTSQMSIPIGTGISALFCLIKLYLGFRRIEPLGVAWTQED